MYDSTLIKLASIAVHAEELIGETDPQAAEFDKQTILGLLSDSHVSKLLDELGRKALLPVKR